MAVQKRITQKNPRTGALPSEQTAQENEQQQQGGAGSGMLESDKLIYQLVENNVGFAGEQFGENLRFNSEVLTNVLYDNIYDLLGDKLEEDKFIDWLAGELVKSGCVIRQEAESEEKPQQEQEPKEEVVYELDDSAYTELKAKVGAAIELIKANRLTIFKLFNDVENHFKTLSDASGKYELDYDTILLKRRDEEITLLVHRLQSNQQKIEDHILITNDTRDEIDEKVDEIQEAVEKVIDTRKKSAIGNKNALGGINDIISKMGSNFIDFNKEQKGQQKLVEKPINDVKEAVLKLKGEQKKKELAVKPSKPEKKSEDKSLLKPPVKKEGITGKPVAKKEKLEKAQKPVVNTKISKKMVKKPILERSVEKKVGKPKKIVVVVIPKGEKKPKKQDVLDKVLKKKDGGMKPKASGGVLKKTKGKVLLGKKPVAGKKGKIAAGVSKYAQKQKKKTSFLKTIVGVKKKITAKVSRVAQTIGEKAPVKGAKSFLGKMATAIPEKFAKAKEVFKPPVISEQKPKFLGLTGMKPMKAVTGKISQVKTTQKTSSIKSSMGKITQVKTSDKAPSIKAKPVKASKLKVAPLKTTIGKVPKLKPSSKASPASFSKKITQKVTKTVSTVVSKVKSTVTRISKSVFQKKTVEKVAGKAKKVTKGGKIPQMVKSPKVKGFAGKVMPQKFAKSAPQKISAGQTKVKALVSGFRKSMPQFAPTGAARFVPRAMPRPQVRPHPRAAFGKPQAFQKPRMVPLKPPSGFKQMKGGFLPKPRQMMPPAPPPPKPPSGKWGAKAGKFSYPDKGMLPGSPYDTKGKFQFPQEDKKDKKTRSLLGKLIGNIFKDDAIEQKKKKKPGLIDKWKFSMKQQIANSKIMQGYRTVKDKLAKAWGGIKKVGRGIKKVAKFAWRVVKGTVKAGIGVVKTGYKVAKFGAKAFVKASKVAGKAAFGLGKLAWRGLKGIVKGIMEDIEDLSGAFGKAGKAGRAAKPAAKAGMKGGPGAMSKKDVVLGMFQSRGLIRKIVDFSPAMWVVKLGFKAIKWGVKMLWKGIKKLVIKTINIFKNLFKLGGKFVNTVGSWAAKLGKGIKDKAYKFLIKPIASILVSVTGFFTGILMSPIQFMKWLIPSIFDKVLGTLTNIAGGIKALMKSTWTVIKKILFNPLTLLVLVGALFYFFKDSLFSWFGEKIQALKDNFVPTIMEWGQKILAFLTKAWDIITTIGGWIWKIVDWITNPEGTIVKFVTAVFTTIWKIKKVIGKLLKAAGKDSIDILCMFLSGDTLGIAIGMIGGLVVKAFKWMKNQYWFKFTVALVKAIVGIIAMIVGFGAFVWASIAGALWQIIKGNFGGVVDALCAPWKAWWEQVTEIFRLKKTADNYEHAGIVPEFLDEDPTEKNAEQAANANIEVRSLKMKGKEQKLATVEKMMNANSAVFGKIGQGQLLPKIQKMNELYQINSEQVEAYSEFISKIWDKGKGNDDLSAQTMRVMLESPDISQKLLSAFFYFNPQTGQTMMLRPAAYIGQFLDNIREAVNDPDRDDQEVFKELIEAFEQTNVERSHIVNNQGAAIEDFAKKINNMRLRADGGIEHEDYMAIRDQMIKFNKGDMFDNIKAESSFVQFAQGESKTRELESVTGRTFGSWRENKFLKVKPLTTKAQNGKVMVDENMRTNVGKDDFVLPPPPKPIPNTIGKLTVPAAMNPPPLPNPDMGTDGKSLVELWLEHQNKRRELLRSGRSSKAVESSGYRDMTYDEFKKEYQKKKPPSEASLAEAEDNKAKRLAALRLSKDIEAYHNQGQEANADGFNLGNEPSIIKIPVEGLTQNLYIFSPEWRRINGASGISDDALSLELNAQDQEARERIRKAKEAELAKKRAEEAQKKREQAILDYSAKVTKDGYIEVKMGEDVVAMQEAYALHQRKRREFIRKGGSPKAADKAGLKDYTWEQWKPYYRKMHGLPADGIKRIPIGKDLQKKPRDIDWSTRGALSTEEMGKYGIQVSKEGPVMIPMDKAMEVANALLTGAKTVHSIRDGLEVMKQGLDSETETLRKRREEGQPMAVVQSGGDSNGETTNVIPDAGGNFEDRW